MTDAAIPTAPPEGWVLVALGAQVPEGQTLCFDLGKPVRDPQAFVVRWQDQTHVYLNRCAHVPVPLDYDDGEFLHPKLGMIACKVHGALYEPGSGECVSGPCRGAGLERLEFQVQGADLWVRWPL